MNLSALSPIDGFAISSRMNKIKGSNAFAMPLGALPGFFLYCDAMLPNIQIIIDKIINMPKTDLVMDTSQTLSF